MSGRDMRTRCWVIKGATRVIQAEMGQFLPRSSLGEAKRRWTWPAVLLEEVHPG